MVDGCSHQLHIGPSALQVLLEHVQGPFHSLEVEALLVGRRRPLAWNIVGANSTSSAMEPCRKLVGAFHGFVVTIETWPGVWQGSGIPRIHWNRMIPVELGSFLLGLAVLGGHDRVEDVLDDWCKAHRSSEHSQAAKSKRMCVVDAG